MKIMVQIDNRKFDNYLNISVNRNTSLVHTVSAVSALLGLNNACILFAIDSGWGWL